MAGRSFFPSPPAPTPDATTLGATLKSQVERHFEHLSEDCVEYIKSMLFACFNDSETAIRKSVSSLITTIIFKGGFQRWPLLLEFMSANLDSQSSLLIANTIDCLQKIIEDLRVNSENFSFLDSSKGGTQLNILIPKLFNFAADARHGEEILALAIHTLNICVQSMPAALAERIDIYLSILIANTTQSRSAAVRLRAFEGLLALVEVRRTTIMKYAETTIPALIAGIQDANNEI